jgi:hypothetical protein
LLFDARRAFNGAALARTGDGQFAVNYDEATDANIFSDSHGGVVGDNGRRFYEG